MSEVLAMPKRTMWAMLALVALMQTAVLAYGVYARDQLLKHGREVVMQVTPVAPRDIFRGDYVILGFPMSMIDYTGEKFGALSEGLEPGGEIYVTMTPGSDSGKVICQKALIGCEPRSEAASSSVSSIFSSAE